MDEQVVEQLAPGGTLRAGLNMGNFLLVSQPEGPDGVAPAMAREIARRLGVTVAFAPFAKPGVLADAAGTGAWDLCLIGADPARAARIAFTPAYVEIPCTFLVSAASGITALAEVDRPGQRIASVARAAYDLWLERNVSHATLVRTDSGDAAAAMLAAGEVDAIGSLKPRLVKDAAAIAGSVLLPGQFFAVQQAIGVLKEHAAALAFLEALVAEVKASGFVAGLIRRFGADGLEVPA